MQCIGDGVPSRQESRRSLRNLIPGAVFRCHFCFDNLALMCFTAANSITIRIFFVARAFFVVEANAADGERAVTGTYAFTSLISIPGPSIVSITCFVLTLVHGREGTLTIGAALLPVERKKRGAGESTLDPTGPSESLRGCWSTGRLSRGVKVDLTPAHPVSRGRMALAREVAPLAGPRRNLRHLRSH